MSDPRVEQITQAFLSNQSRGGLDDICVYMAPSGQFGQGFGDFIRMPSVRRRPLLCVSQKLCLSPAPSH